MRSVLIIQRLVAHYRESFFVALEDDLRSRGIALVLRGGQARPEECQVDCLDALPFGERCPNRYVAKQVYWQAGALDRLSSMDLVIVEQANGALVNYPILVRRALGRTQPLVAFWGHGANLHTVRPQRLRAAWKRSMIRQVDWWFAYTGLTERIVAGAGFPRERITVVNNAIDTTEMRRQVASVPDEARMQLRRELFGADAADALVGLYCGRLYHLRRIPFLLETCDALHAQAPAFRMIVVGVGPDAEMVRTFAQGRPWFRYVGEKYAADLAPYLRTADAFLMPGMLGLNILDAFAAGLPVFTTDCGIHSPEVEYLEPGVNGIMTPPDVGSYAAALFEVVERRSLLGQLKTGALKTSERFSAPAMARAFADGITTCLHHRGRSTVGNPRLSAA